ncbi:MAG: SHOCT domain-containing protein [Actinomycetota bacterium]
MLTMATELASHGDWGPGPWWPIFPLLWVLLLGAVIFAVVRSKRRGWHQGHTAEAVLAERYARGEITVEEYRERLAVLKDRSA